MKSSFLSQIELDKISFRKIGRNVKISRNVSIYSPENISIGNNVRVDDFCILSGGEKIVLGNHIHIGSYSALFGGSGIILNDFCNISCHVTILSEGDDISGQSMTGPVIPKKFKPKYKIGLVELERHSGVCINSTIMPGVILEEGCIVGANSFVTKRCDPWTIYFGVPAKKLKTRSKKILELEIKFLNEWKKQNDEY